MRKALRKVLGGCCALMGVAGSAAAADLAGRWGQFPQQPTDMSSYSWAGAYLGLNLGVQSIQAPGGDRRTGAAGGAQAGYNWQIGSFVLGSEGDVQLSAAEAKFAAYQFANPWFGSLRGRAGFAVNNVLFYTSAGLSYGGIRAQLPSSTEGRAQVGWTAGAGLEVGIGRRWSARAEYMVMDLTDRAVVFTGNNTNLNLDSRLLRLGVNYRF